MSALDHDDWRKNERTLRRAERRRFADQLPDFLDALTGAVRGGLSLGQGLARVTEQSPEPTRRILTPAVGRVLLGSDVATELAAASTATRSEELAWVSHALRVHSRVGGDVGDLLSVVADSVRTRQRAHSQLRALTAEGRLSGRVLAVLPVATLALLGLISPAHVSTLVGTPVGRAMSALAAVLFAVGLWWMRQVIRHATW